MNKIDKIREIFKPQIEWYLKNKSLEDDGVIDNSYIYDELYDEFNNVSRGDWLDFMEALVDEN